MSEKSTERSEETKIAPKQISSRSNPTFKLLRSLLESRGIRKHGKALLAGWRIIDEVLSNHPDKCLALVTKKDSKPPDLPSARLPDNFTWYQLDKELFDEIDVWNATDYLILVEISEFPHWDPGKASEGCSLFIPFQDPSNVGAVIRSAAAFGVSAIVFLEEAAHPFHPKSVRAASGNLFSTPMFTGPSIDDLDVGDLPLIVLDPKGEDIRSFKPPTSCGLLCGMEGPGVPDAISSSAAIHRVRIPISDAVESLNAAVATSIALYVLRRKP